MTDAGWVDWQEEELLRVVPPEDRVRVLRVLMYEGPRSWVEETVAKAIHGTMNPGRRNGVECKITAATLTEFPEVLEREGEEVGP